MEQFSRPQDGDQNRGPVLVKVDVVFTAAAIIATFLRVSARLGSTLKVSWDDYLIVSSTVRISNCYFVLFHIDAIIRFSQFQVWLW